MHNIMRKEEKVKEAQGRDAIKSVGHVVVVFYGLITSVMHMRQCVCA